MTTPVDALTALTDQLADAIADRLATRLTPPTVDTTPWMNVEQAAAYIVAPVSRVYDLVARERDPLPHHRDGRRLLFHRDDLDAYLRGTS